MLSMTILTAWRRYFLREKGLLEKLLISELIKILPELY
jgi:hypothetical protein